jgi:hypothetical protein
MSHEIEAAKSGRAICATCGEKIGKGVTRVAELYQDSTHGRPMYDERYRGDGNYSRSRSEHREAIQRFHHLQCAIDKHPTVVATALKRPHDASLIEDRAALDKQLAAAMEEERKARVAAATARMAPPVEAAAEDPNLDPLLAQLADDPENPETIAIVGDLYQARNDPRGELIAIQLATRNAKRERGPEVANPKGRTRAQEVEDTTTKDLGARRDQLIAHLTPKLDSADRSLWGLGFIRRIEIGARSGNRIGELAGLWSHPSVRVLTELRLELPQPTTEIVEQLAATLPRSLRELEIAAAPGGVSLQPIVAALPRLTRLSLLGRMPDAELAHPGITSLALGGYGYLGAPAGAISVLSPARLPAVREIVLRDWNVVDDPIGAFARSPWPTAIERLHIDKPHARFDANLGPMPLEWAETLARGLGTHKLRRLEITAVPIPLPVRAALTPLCDELVCPSHAVVLDETTTHVTHANKPEWGRGKIVKRANGKLEVKFGKELKVFKADAPFLVPAADD